MQLFDQLPGVVLAAVVDEKDPAVGCGAVGGSSSSNNIGPLDLINLRRVAWGVREIGKSGQTKPESAPDQALIDALTEKILQKLL